MAKFLNRAQVMLTQARCWLISGHVQGVGFRPFVYRLAHHYKLSGWVRNRLGQVEIVAQGKPPALNAFGTALISQAPLIARPHIESVEPTQCSPRSGFRIVPSSALDEPRIQVPPDYFLCEDCLAELKDLHNRRYRYPFINCTQCGPRYTLIRTLPYDRPNTSMAGFVMCPDCRQEYADPLNRRFHAEPIACAQCGPQLQFHSPKNNEWVNETQAALLACIVALRAGKTVAVKGVGGYHLLCDAHSDLAVGRLRTHKPRPDKPLAVMFPEGVDKGLATVLKEVYLSDEQRELLTGCRRPIVLARKRAEGLLSGLLAAGLDEVGVMLPYTPLHHLLLDDFGGPLVVTSANLSGEPVLTENAEIQDRLAKVAQAFLHHDRPIVRPADDSVFRTIQGAPRPLRLGRGHAPVELELPFTLDRPVLAVGGHIKNTVALGWGNRVVISPHIGDLQAPRSQAVFEQNIAELQLLYKIRAQTVVCDAHPGYASSRWARHCGLPVEKVYHHPAHASALIGEHGFDRDWMVFTWDGTGLGQDGSLWGGEMLIGKPGRWRRSASFRPFYLPGGEKAGRQPWRSAAALCWGAGIDWPTCPADADLMFQAWQRRLNCPQSSAAGRLFDAAASLTGVLHEASFEGQGPMLLEARVKEIDNAESLPLEQDQNGLWRSDWQPLIADLMDDSRSVMARAGRFHAAMAKVILDQARLIGRLESITHVGLCGGVFQNRQLTEQVVALLGAAGFEVQLAQRLPCNDGGLSFGQIVEYGARIPPKI
ncbi:MAG: carbamoyltransferase HypF [Pseudomonadota bacterium]